MYAFICVHNRIKENLLRYPINSILFSFYYLFYYHFFSFFTFWYSVIIIITCNNYLIRVCNFDNKFLEENTARVLIYIMWYKTDIYIFYVELQVRPCTASVYECMYMHSAVGYKPRNAKPLSVSNRWFRAIQAGASSECSRKIISIVHVLITSDKRFSNQLSF